MFVSDIQASLQARREIIIDSFEELVDHKHIHPIIDKTASVYNLTIDVRKICLVTLFLNN